MQILAAEFAVAENSSRYLAEGREMLRVLVESFNRLGHQTIYPTAGVKLEQGEGVPCQSLDQALEELAPMVDAGIVIAPDELLAGFTSMLEENTVNLGSPPGAVEMCADKEKCTKILESKGIPTPRIPAEPGKDTNKKYVVKPRLGCGSEDTHITSSPWTEPGFIATEYIEGEHLSASIVLGENRILPITLNLQYLEFWDDKISYLGGRTPYLTPRCREVIETASRAAAVLGCRGYTGVDVVLADKAYVVDVNPRPTTSIVGISRILNLEIADLILKARFGELPETVETRGNATYTKSRSGK